MVEPIRQSYLESNFCRSGVDVIIAGIGGNRTLWGDKHEITAVEFNERIAEKYRDLFPNDDVVVGDAYKYFLEHFKEYDLLEPVINAILLLKDRNYNIKLYLIGDGPKRKELEKIIKSKTRKNKWGRIF